MRSGGLAFPSFTSRASAPWRGAAPTRADAATLLHGGGDIVPLFRFMSVRELVANARHSRNEIEAIDFVESVETLNKRFIETGYSKILVYNETMGNVSGYVHSFELFQKPSAVKNILRPLAIIPETATADKVLKILISQKKHVALVVDEYGGTSGMLTLEDIVEEICGEIEDEHDVEELVENKLPSGEYKLSARLEVDYLNDQYDLALPISEEYETLAGLIIEVNEDLPDEGDFIDVADYSIEITNVSDRKIEEVHLRPSQTAN